MSKTLKNKYNQRSARLAHRTRPNSAEREEDGNKRKHVVVKGWKTCCVGGNTPRPTCSFKALAIRTPIACFRDTVTLKFT